MRHQKITTTVRTITPEEALAQGSTPGFLRTVANSLERIGKSSGASAQIKYVCTLRGDVRPDTIHGLTGFDASVSLRSAYELRKVARVVERTLAGRL